jgi:hypothetical protein
MSGQLTAALGRVEELQQALAQAQDAAAKARQDALTGA